MLEHATAALTRLDAQALQELESVALRDFGNLSPDLDRDLESPVQASPAKRNAPAADSKVFSVGLSEVAASQRVFGQLVQSTKRHLDLLTHLDQLKRTTSVREVGLWDR